MFAHPPMKRLRIWSVLLAAAVALVGFSVGPVSAEAATPSSTFGLYDDPSAAMQNWLAQFWQNGQLYTNTDHTGAPGWFAGSALMSIVSDYERYGKASDLQLISKMYDYLTSYAPTGYTTMWGPVSNWCANMQRTDSSEFSYDDAMWTALPLYEAYQVTGIQKYSDAAKTVFDCEYQQGYHDESAAHDGSSVAIWYNDGAIWHGNEYSAGYLSFALIQLAYQLGDQYPTSGARTNDTYTQEAAAMWNWAANQGNLVNLQTGDVYNARGIPPYTPFNGGTQAIDYNGWSYNAGSMLGAAAEAYQRTSGATQADILAKGKLVLSRVMTHDPSRPDGPVSASVGTNTSQYNITKADGSLTAEYFNNSSAVFKRDLLDWTGKFIYTTGDDPTMTSTVNNAVNWMATNGAQAWANRDPQRGIIGQYDDADFTRSSTTNGGRLDMAPTLSGAQAVISAPTFGLTDLASGHTATASSTASGSNASNPLSGAYNSSYSSQSDTNAKWYQVDLGSVQTIDSVETAWGRNFASQYQIQTSTDGTNWTTVATRSSANQNMAKSSGLTTDQFAPTGARYVKLTATAPPANYTTGSSWSITLDSFRVFDNPQPTAPPSSSPRSTITPAGSMAIVVRGSDNQVYQKVWNTSGWSSFVPLGGPVGGVVVGSPTVIATNDRTDIFVRGTDNQLWQNYWARTTGVWSGWILLGGSLADSPSATYDPNGNIVVVVRSTDNQLSEKMYSQSIGWGAWQALGGPTDGVFTGAPAITETPGRMDVFVRGTDDQLWQRVWTSAGGWSTWGTLGGTLADSPAASWDTTADRLTVVARGADNAVWETQWTPQGWAGWTRLGAPNNGIVFGSASVITQSARVDVFAHGTDNQLWQRIWTSTAGWSGWIALGGGLG